MDNHYCDCCRGKHSNVLIFGGLHEKKEETKIVFSARYYFSDSDGTATGCVSRCVECSIEV